MTRSIPSPVRALEALLVASCMAAAACSAPTFHLADEPDDAGPVVLAGDAGLAPLAPPPPPPVEECRPAITAVIRDFDVSHADFEDENPGLTTGLVRDRLDEEGKPRYAHGDEPRGGIASQASFHEWYRDMPGVNQRFEVALPFDEQGDSRVVFDEGYFFPVDDRGFGNSGEDDLGVAHNFHFTTEIHTEFVYRGGETFTFRGDDDLWLFVDGRLALDLGGTHLPTEGTVHMDELGLTPGQRYRVDIFHAERHTWLSSFRIETTIECFTQPELI